MPVHIHPQVSDFDIYFYDNGCSFERRDPYRAIMSGTIITGVEHGVMLHGLCGRLEAGDTDELAAKLKARGFEQVWCEVSKNTTPSRLLKKVEELEHTNIYYCDLREI